MKSEFLFLYLLNEFKLKYDRGIKMAICKSHLVESMSPDIQGSISICLQVKVIKEPGATRLVFNLQKEILYMKGHL